MFYLKCIKIIIYYFKSIKSLLCISFENDLEYYRTDKTYRLKQYMQEVFRGADAS